MIEKTPWLDRLTVLLLIIGVAFLCFPLYYTFVASTLTLEEVSRVPMPMFPGNQFFHNAKIALAKGDLVHKMLNSLYMAIGITVGKISISMLSAFAMTYFNFRFRKTAFWMIFLTLMVPVEVRILPTYEVVSNVLSPIVQILSWGNIQVVLNWSLLDSYTGLILPLICSATATFLFRQFFLTIPDELCDAAKIDGLTPMQFFWHILLPLSRTNIAALTVIIFVYGWNQYLWPLLVTTKPEMQTAIIGIQGLIPKMDEMPEWHVAMAGCILVMLPPVLVVIFMQRWFVKGLIENEK
jgi:sn-glycerol 3-phosphate transport system permease protein